MRLFTHDQFVGSGRMFSADASELGLKPGQVPFARLFSDACDVGFELLQRNGQRAKFFLTEEHKSDGDVVAWTFMATTDSIHRNPRLQGVEIRVYND